MSGVEVKIVESAQGPCFELIALPAATPSDFDTGWPFEPGAVQSDSSGPALAMHFAPGRWLVPDPSPQLAASLAKQATATLVDVEGKWRRLELRGSAVERALRASIPLDSALAGRECAAIAIFDCPTVLHRRNASAYDTWVHASYLDTFKKALSKVSRAHLASIPVQSLAT